MLACDNAAPIFPLDYACFARMRASSHRGGGHNEHRIHRRDKRGCVHRQDWGRLDRSDWRGIDIRARDNGARDDGNHRTRDDGGAWDDGDDGARNDRPKHRRPAVRATA